MSRFLDERGRIFGKVNIIDILVLLVIVAVVVFAVVRLTGNAATTVPVRVTFQVKEIRNADARRLQTYWKSGVTLSEESGTVLGKVQEVTVTPTREEYLTSDNQLQEFDSPILSDVDVVVLGSAQRSNTSAHIGSVSVNRGDKVVVLGGQTKEAMIVTDLVWNPESVK